MGRPPLRHHLGELRRHQHDREPHPLSRAVPSPAGMAGRGSTPAVVVTSPPGSSPETTARAISGVRRCLTRLGPVRERQNRER